MVLMFEERFCPAVLAGRKLQTFRRTVRCKPGDPLSLRRWEGRPYWSKQVVLREAVCRSVVPAVVDVFGVEVGGVAQKNLEAAWADGFRNWCEMRGYFEDHGGLPFNGFLVEWELKGGEG